MSKISNVENTLKDKESNKNKVEPKVEKEVWIDTQGEIVQINGIRFEGKQKVLRDYAPEIERIVAARKEQSRKEKEFIEHPDMRGLVPGRVYR